MTSPSSQSRAGLLLAGALLAIPLATPARAADPAEMLAKIQARLSAQEARIAEQDRRLADQAAMLETQSLELRALRDQRDEVLSEIRAGQSTRPAPVQIAAAQARPATDGLPGQPVGEAPPPERRVAEVSAIPEGMGVLTPPGRLVFDPSIEFVRSSANRLVFRGVEIVPGINFGLIEANDADRDSLVGAVAVRYGLTDRLEIEGRVPYVYRHDRVTTVETGEPDPVQRTSRLEGQDIGDVEVAARYQLNGGLNGWPIFVANARVKTPTGVGPYDVRFNESGIATTLATGSGFWSGEAGVTMLYPTDPAVIFAGLTYVRNFADDIDKTFGQVRVGRVDPGDSVGASLGFGLALNPRFSISLGYSHNYIFGTESELQSGVLPPSIETSNSLQVGSIQMGWSFRLTEKVTLNNNFEFGVTSDAPDVRIVFRAPYRF